MATAEFEPRATGLRVQTLPFGHGALPDFFQSCNKYYQLIVKFVSSKINL